MRINPNDAAYTGTNRNPRERHGISEEKGLTIRAELAARALQGLLSSWGQHDVTSMEELASDAVRAADALIEQLNKEI